MLMLLSQAAIDQLQEMHLQYLKQRVQHIWKGALNKKGIALQHKLDFAIVARTGLHEVPYLCR